MQLLTAAEQMQSYDRSAIKTFGIAGLVLMENAGRAFVDELARRMPDLSAKNILVVCGKGNNGGDGFVIARHLVNRGCRVHVALLCRPAEVKGDAKTNLLIVQKMVKGGGPISIEQITAVRKISRLPKPEVIVDAIFGTGFQGRVGGIQKPVIEWINTSGAYVASVDIASGVHSSTGIVANVAVKANLTVTMGLAKVGHYVGDGREHSGEVVPVDISIPSFCFTPVKNQVYRVEAHDVAGHLPRRPLRAHKYGVGKVYVLAGSRGFTGAAVLCAQAAMRAGAGATVLGAPRSLHQVLARKLTEVILHPLDETPEGTLASSAYAQIRERVAWADAVAMGPGLSQHPDTLALVLRLAAQIDKPLVVDADGLNMLAEKPSVLNKRTHATILTPHTGELSRLIAHPSRLIEAHRVDMVRSAARRLTSIVVLKGNPTATGVPSGEVYLNSTGNPGMATIGSGDVLTGIIPSLLAQGMDPVDATYAGVFLHGLAGDLAAQDLGQRSVMALDILDRIPRALQSLEQ